MLTKSGAASTTLTYDERGNLIEEMALGPTDTPLGVVYNATGDGQFHLNPGAYVGVYQALSTRNGGEIVSADQY